MSKQNLHVIDRIQLEVYCQGEFDNLSRIFKIQIGQNVKNHSSDMVFEILIKTCAVNFKRKKEKEQKDQ